MKILVVGAGMYGATVARVCHDAGHQVQVMDRRPHLAGNCYTQWDERGHCHEHVYGAHIFHTNDEAVWKFLNRWTTFRPYRHVVKVQAGGGVYPLPFNLLTWNLLHGAGNAEKMRRAVEGDARARSGEKTVDGWCYRNIGAKAYRKLVRDYTEKQWGCHPRELPASIIRRVPIRWTYEDGYFTDTYQGIPAGGYTRMFERMLDGIPVALERGLETSEIGAYDQVFYSGGLDELFGYELGALGYRRVRFDRTYLPEEMTQGQAVMNHADKRVAYTRTLEHRYFEGWQGEATGHELLRSYEYPQAWQPGEDGFYPVRDELNMYLHRQYMELAGKEYGGRLTVGGRQGRYQYYDMHQVCAMALKDAQTYLEKTR